MSEKSKIISADYQIENMMMMKSYFNRVNIVNFDDDIIDRNTEVKVHVSKHSDDINSVTETVVYTHINKQTQEEEVRIEVTMIGIFKCLRETDQLSFKQFSNVNAPAIMFPYIREHITSISLKASIGAVFLSPVDFWKLPHNEE